MQKKVIFLVKTSILKIFSLILISYLLSSCKVYQENVLFKTESSIKAEVFKLEKEVAEKNYKIQAYDIIKLEVFTNFGEILIDPNMDLLMQGGAGGAGMGRNLFSREFRVDSEGLAYLPMIGGIDLTGKTLYQADSILVKEYEVFYKDAFVRLNLINKRVFVLGAMGGQVIPLANDGMNLIEVLSLTGGLQNNARGSNIRLIRGDLDNPSVQLIDLTTIEGLKKASVMIEPGDIIYVEPLRRVVIEGLRDAAPFIGLVTNLVTLAVIVQNFRNMQNSANSNTATNNN